MPALPSWIRTALSLVGLVALGALVLATVAWLVVLLVPAGTFRPDEPSSAAVTTVPVDVVEVGVAAPGDAAVQVGSCEVVDDVIQAAGRLQNTSGERQAFVFRLAVLVGDRLYDGTTSQVAVPALADGDVHPWELAVGAVDPDVPTAPLTCEVDRVALAQELTP